MLQRALRYFYSRLSSKLNEGILGSYDENLIKYKGQEASDLIMEYIKEGKPFAVGRLGTELFTMLNYKEANLPYYKKIIKSIQGELYFRNWKNDNIKNLCFYTGFFPEGIKEAEIFSKMMIAEMKKVDIWGAFSKIEYKFNEELKHAKKIRLTDIEPFLHDKPWTSMLEGKKVLVIHPFESSIKNQYKKREKIFENKSMLPSFELITLKAVQSLAMRESGFTDWFEALDYMKNKINLIDFDIAIIGCGAYSLPLSTHIKAKGKIAIYMGGSTQILFGIKGKRWEDFLPISSLFNENWVRPLEEEKISNSQNIEKGCYW